MNSFSFLSNFTRWLNDILFVPILLDLFAFVTVSIQKLKSGLAKATQGLSNGTEFFDFG